MTAVTKLSNYPLFYGVTFDRLSKDKFMINLHLKPVLCFLPSYKHKVFSTIRYFEYIN